MPKEEIETRAKMSTLIGEKIAGVRKEWGQTPK